MNMNPETASQREARKDLSAALRSLRSQVLETRDNPAAPSAGQTVAGDIYAEAEECRYSAPGLRM